MAWPIQYTSLAAQGVSAIGPLPSYLGWGTDQMVTNTIVKNIRASQMIEEYVIENGAGLPVKQVLIYSGDEVEIVCVDDRSLTWPIAGGIITVINPQPNGAPSETYQVINNNYTVARKVEGERTILAKRYLLITPTQM